MSQEGESPTGDGVFMTDPTKRSNEEEAEHEEAPGSAKSESDNKNQEAANLPDTLADAANGLLGAAAEPKESDNQDAETQENIDNLNNDQEENSDNNKEEENPLQTTLDEKANGLIDAIAPNDEKVDIETATENENNDNNENDNNDNNENDNDNVYNDDNNYNDNYDYGETMVTKPPKGQVTQTTDGVGILNFEDHYPDDRVPVFTEEATLVAMERLAIEPKNLMKPQPADFAEYPDFPDVRAKVESTLMARRDSLIQQVIEEREQVLHEKKRSTGPTTRGLTAHSEEENNSARLDAIERIERMQRREIEQLIVAELVREQTIRDEEEIRLKREERQRQLAAEVRQKQIADAERRRQKDEVLVLRIQEREAQLLELKKKNEEEVERNQKIIAEMKAKKMKEMAEADIQRQRKAIAQREAIEKQLEEEKKKIIERQKEQVARERLMEMRRIEQIQKIKERNQKIMIAQKQRFEASQQRGVQVLEEKRKSMELKEIAAKGRYENVIKQRDLIAQRQRAKSELQIQRNQNARVQLEKMKEERIRKLVCKDSHDQERRDAIMAVKLERMKKERQIEMEKQLHIQQQNEERAQKAKEKADAYMAKTEESEKRLEEVKKLKDDELIKRVAIQRLHDKMRDEAAERKEKQKAYKIIKRSEINNEREKNAIEYVLMKQEIAEKNREAGTQLAFRKEQAIWEFREMMRRQGQIDLNALANKFGIDVEFLKEKVAQSRRGKRVESGVSRPTSSMRSYSAPVKGNNNDYGNSYEDTDDVNIDGMSINDNEDEQNQNEDGNTSQNDEIVENGGSNIKDTEEEAKDETKTEEETSKEETDREEKPTEYEKEHQSDSGKKEEEENKTDEENAKSSHESEGETKNEEGKDNVKAEKEEVAAA